MIKFSMVGKSFTTSNKASEAVGEHEISFIKIRKKTISSIVCFWDILYKTALAERNHWDDRTNH